MPKLARLLMESRAAQGAEIAAVFLIATLVISIGWRLVGEGLIARQAVVWVANVLMLLTVWAGLRLRGQSWEHFGLTLQFQGVRRLVVTAVKSVAVLVVAIVAFVLGSIVMMNLKPQPEQADMSGYNYLSGNLPMLLLALVAVYIVSSFGEEVIYRGFLITRLGEMGGNSRVAVAIAVVVSSVVFGLAHFSWGLTGVVQTTFMGLALALAYLITRRSLWTLVLAHVYLDTALLVQLYFAGPDAG